jgi:hypothetical protein
VHIQACIWSCKAIAGRIAPASSYTPIGGDGSGLAQYTEVRELGKIPSVRTHSIASGSRSADLLHGLHALVSCFLDSGSGAFGRVVLLRCNATGALFAVKYMHRGPHIDERTVREIVNHRRLKHPNVVRFLEVRMLKRVQHASGAQRQLLS